jgi:transcription-repair coupling factor (superfamily II helicase)
VDCINVVQRHVGADGAAPTLDKLGGTSWARTKEKARESLLAMAHELLGVQAAREAHGRTPYVTRDALYDDFVARFPFEETADQQRAIEQVLEDLQGPRPMDRLVCGDVGFGKTEVALRAAFLTVLGGRQVAVLVPTTLLAQQHFETFRVRLDGHPIVVEVVSRFRAPRAEQGDARARRQRTGRHRHRHAATPTARCRLPRSRTARHRRGASLRRAGQRTRARDARLGRRAHPHGDPDPADVEPVTLGPS